MIMGREFFFSLALERFHESDSYVNLWFLSVPEAGAAEASGKSKLREKNQNEYSSFGLNGKSFLIAQFVKAKSSN